MKRLDLLLQYLEETPDDLFLQYALAKEYEKQGMEQKAIDALEKLRKNNSNYIATYYHLGKIYERQGKSALAITIYEEGISIADQIGDAHTKRELIGAKSALEES